MPSASLFPDAVQTAADSAGADSDLSNKGLGSRLPKRKGTGVAFALMKAAEAKARQDKAADYEQIVLDLEVPNWTSLFRSVPNGFLRSGLFTACSKKARAKYDGHKVASLANYDIRYSGSELRQDDFSVWIALMTRAKSQHLGDKLFFTAYSMLTELEWGVNSLGYKHLRECIERLKHTTLKIESNKGRAAYAGSLIRDYAYDAVDPNGKVLWAVRLEPDIAQLFVNETTTFLQWRKRTTLGSHSPLAQWLHGYFASHTECYPVSIAKLHELCESKEAHLRNFKIRVRRSLEQLVQENCLASYQIVNDFVHVDMPQRSLAAN
jgi:hypothetical protein